jgi:Fic family protein
VKLLNDDLLADYERATPFLEVAWRDFGGEKFDFDFYLTASVVNSAQIEGNSLDLNSFINQSQDEEQKNSKQVTEILDLKAAYQKAGESEFNEANLLRAHGLASATILGGGGGKYRRTPVGVFSRGGLTYLAVEPELVAREMVYLWADMGEVLARELTVTETFYYASLVHLHLAHIHPFADGNGRLARLLEKWFLSQKLGERAWYVQSEAYYLARRGEYYHNINLGVNYYEADYGRALPFLEMLAKSIEKKDVKF